MSSRSSTPRMWFSARPVSTSGSSRACAASAASATPRRGEVDVVDRTGRRVVVLDRKACRSGRREQGDRLGHAARVVRVAALAVDVERERRSPGQRGNVRDELVARHPLVQLSRRPGESRARRRERLETGRFEEAGRAGVPRVRHHEQLLPLVNRPKAGPASFFRHARFLRSR